MKIEKRHSVKYPLLVKLDTGEEIKIPKQSKFDNEWLKRHGCSLVAENIALQFLGVQRINVNGKRVGIYPINLLKWHKEHTPKEVKTKVTVKGVSEGINKLAKEKGKAVYYKKPNEVKMRVALSEGDLVIMEQKKPIHTIVLLPDKSGVYMASHGNVEKVKLSEIIKTATNNLKYRGMAIVRKEK